ncbi:similarity to sodium/hydrogen exchanger and potassium exchanger [Ectocarpus siliculosus]|uniref:Similarity to sodium/hydrogen exchanger and potassium exchanger n=1 Tax=Ectocarpus siliculosus TaxID=2880 RepID=D8LS49_ECTSI|nr:similarity to sodium/hydrogen exchanger and potassium exchanger [Ectocarpus siliculosus]|eukprot:CBN75106.1 similarity to sodium/hydrogen exchanger and potassium exchanger [Ectocarpus siliculosus]
MLVWAVLCCATPVAVAFVSPKARVARLSALGKSNPVGKPGVTSHRWAATTAKHGSSSGRATGTGRRLHMRMGSAAPVDAQAVGEGRGRRRKAFRARVGALFRGTAAGDTRLERATYLASYWLRAARRVASKRALTVALAFTLAFPSLIAPRFSPGGTEGGLAAGGAGSAHPAVELVLPFSENAAAAEQATPAPATGGARGVREQHQQHQGVVSGGAGRTGASRAAFVGPWGKEEGDRGGDAQGARSSSKGGLSAAAVRAPSKRVGGTKRGKAVEKDGTKEALRSMATKAGVNGREIAEDFWGHIQGAKRDVLVILMANALIIPVCKRVGLSPVLGFLAAGVALGPNCLSIVSDVKAIEVLGEMGIVFFLFEMGLELSVTRLMAMKRDVFGLGLATFGVSAAAVAGACYVAGLTGAQMVVIGGGVALSSSAFVLQLLRDRDDLGTRYGRACFGILLFQDLAVVPLLVAIPLLAGGGGGLAAALTSAATKAAIALGLIAFIGKNILSRFFLLVAKSKSQEAFLAVILLTVIALSSITEGLGLSGTLGAFLAGTLLADTKYTPQVEADIAPFRALLLGMFFMTVGFEIDLALCFNNLPLVASLVSGLLAMKAAIIALIALAFGLSVANAQQTGLLLSQGGEFAFVAFGMAERLGIIEPQLCKLLLTTVAISMAATPALSNFSAWVADQMEARMGYDHYLGGDSESDEIRQGDGFVVVCGYGRIGRLVCELLGKKFINFVAFDNNPLKAMEARNRGLPVFYGDVMRPEVLNAFNVGKAKAVICTLSEVKGTTTAVVNLRREFPDLPIFARAQDARHQKNLASITDVVAMVPTLPEDSIIVSLPFGGAVLRSLGCTADEVNVLLEDTRKKFVLEKGLENEEDDNLFEQLGIQKSMVETYTENPILKDAGGAVDADTVETDDARDAGKGSAAAATKTEKAAEAAAAVAAVAVASAAAKPTAATDLPGLDGSSDSDEDVAADGSAAAAEAQATVAAAAAAVEPEPESSEAARAAAAALEAAVASGDVVYPKNDPTHDADKDGEDDLDGGIVNGEEGEGEELAASVGSKESS